jgi:hypothetical protein
MITHMAAYLAGPGHAGFTAWMDQKCPGGYISAEIIRGNMETISAKIKASHGQ